MRVIVSVGALLAIWLSAGVEAQSAQNVELAFSARPTAVLGEPVIVQLTIRNGSAEPIDFDLGDDRKGNLRIRITRPDGVANELPRYVANGAFQVGRVSLAPAEALVQQYVLNEWTPLNLVGAYRVQITLVDARFRTRSGASLAPAASELVELVVEPHDAAQLREACELFAERAITATLAQAKLDAGRALAQFTDPGVIPCFERVSRATTHLDSFIVPALVRIGTPQAEAVLLEMFKSADTDRYKKASDALRRFRLRSN